jgi:hypothetical protein
MSQRVEVAALVLEAEPGNVGRVEDLVLAVAAFRRAGFIVTLLPLGSTVRLRTPSRGWWQVLADRLAQI